jgi:acetolactate synthase-1/2/3 large subunit
MNGAESLVRTLVANGVDMCFTNPGTSEMHFVAALDRVEGMGCVLCLFEGVATGAADGWARMTGRPASTLLHLGPGLANGLANLHNAKKAMTPVVNIVGEHATWHLEADAPLTSDIEGLARPMSGWVKTGRDSTTIAAEGAEAIAAAMAPPGQVATLILPADTAWGPGGAVAKAAAPPARAKAEEAAVAAAAEAMRRGKRTALLVGGPGVATGVIELAAKAAAHTGARLMGGTSIARIARGAGRPRIERIPYYVDAGLAFLADVETLVVCGGRDPVAFFGYPGKPSRFMPEGSEVIHLAGPGDDVEDALARLVERLGAEKADYPKAELARPQPPTGALTGEACAAALAALLPEGAILTDESVSFGRKMGSALQFAPPHEVLQLTGGSIGEGMPLGLGAAVACPDRKVVSLQADGSGMYTLQALWSQARVKANALTVIWSNRSYEILRGELTNVGAENPGRKALDQLSLRDPDLDWVALAAGMGVPGVKAETAEEFSHAVRDGMAERGPFLIEAVV